MAAIELGHLKKFVLRIPSLYFCSIRLTSMCTQSCMQCGIPAQSDGSFIDLEHFETILKKLKRHGNKRINLTGGEPAIHPHLEEIFRLLAKYEFTNTALLTNLYYFEALQDRVIDLACKYDIGINTSYDGLADVADKLRGATDVQNIVEEGVRKINEARRREDYSHRPTATVVISQINLHQIPEIIQRIKELGWNLNIDVYRYSSENHREQDEMKITSRDELLNLLPLIQQTQHLKTPLWYFDGWQKHKHKQCPYMISPTFGSKFFVHETGDLYTCLPEPIGNLINDDIKDIFASEKWKDAKAQFAQCPGCWNTCYTISSRAVSYLHWGTIRQYLLKRPKLKSAAAVYL
ncbi:MAG: radical SAM protein [Candidatus Cloacimonadaceae bacterium]|nr:radical SAM protein [Candidatus Cloacimonadota bacterium]MCK9243235.1 radical SAM protein [Candidatus Cloacimonadota bacterium]MDY0126768.1 radical SAM protein [Candidatus Cloacimonadaceae bacterium]